MPRNETRNSQMASRITSTTMISWTLRHDGSMPQVLETLFVIRSSLICSDVSTCAWIIWKHM